MIVSLADETGWARVIITAPVFPSRLALVSTLLEPILAVMLSSYFESPSKAGNWIDQVLSLTRAF